MQVLRRSLLAAAFALGALRVLPVHAAEPVYDVIVLGGGIAGLSAALEAAQNGKKVAIVQVQPILGGDSYLSTGWFYACNSSLQQRLTKEPDTPEQFARDSIAIAEGRRDPMWVDLVARRSGEDIGWLEKNGVVFEDFVTSSMGSTVPRAIQVKGYGRALINALADAIGKTGNARILLETRASGLVVENGRLTGVTIEQNGKSSRLSGRAVILATGGFPFNRDMVRKYAPKFAAMGAVGDPNLKGDGLQMALELGARPRNLDVLNIVPTTNKENRIYLTSGALSGGGILVNEKGERFCNELKSYTDTALAMLDQEHVYEIMVPKVHSKVGVLAQKEMIGRADTIEALAEKLSVPAGNLAREIDAHNRATEGTIKDRFGRVVYKAKLEPPFCFMEVMPLILHTQGGIVTNEKAQVLGENNRPLFENLFAVGDVVSGYLDGGYRSGDALTFGLVSGRIAGSNI